MIRAYALQHLFTWYEDAVGADPGESIGEAELAAVADLFWRMTDHPEGSIASTALLGVCHLAGHDPQLDVTRVAEKSRALIDASHVDPLVEISVFQVAALLNLTNVVARALDVARVGDGIAVRVSAIAAVGGLGGKTEAALLESLLEDPNASIRTAARAAITRLKSNHGG